MNKDLLNQIPHEEQPLASRLRFAYRRYAAFPGISVGIGESTHGQSRNNAAGARLVFKNLVTRGMGDSRHGWCAPAQLDSWLPRSPAPPAAGTTETGEVSFADSVRAGNICAAPLALAHGFAVFLTNPDKTGFVALDAENTIGELRSFAWSADGKRLALVGNSMGQRQHLSDRP